MHASTSSSATRVAATSQMLEMKGGGAGAGGGLVAGCLARGQVEGAARRGVGVMGRGCVPLSGEILVI